MYEIEDLKYLNGTRLLLIIAKAFVYVFFQSVALGYVCGHVLMTVFGMSYAATMVVTVVLVVLLTQVLNRKRSDLVSHAGEEFYMRYM
jgi:hypothetical protein